MSEAEEILIITTGGTIDKVYFDDLSDYRVGDSIVDKLLKEAHVHHPYRLQPIMQKDSLELDDSDRTLIRETAKTASSRRIIITHGTDTMTDTAAFLTDLSDKTIVLTGALAPARFAMSDATLNVGMALAAVQALDSGVYIVMNGTVFHAETVVKNRQLNRFEIKSG